MAWDLAQKLWQTLGNKCWQDNLDIVVVVVVVVVQWSTYLPSIPMIWIRILLWSTVFLRKLFFEKQENKQKEASISQFLGWFRLCSYCGFLSLYHNPTPVALTEHQCSWTFTEATVASVASVRLFIFGLGAFLFGVESCEISLENQKPQKRFFSLSQKVSKIFSWQAPRQSDINRDCQTALIYLYVDKS